MKKSFILAFILLSPVLLLAQSREPMPLNFSFIENGLPVTRPLNGAALKQTKFMFTWQWSTGRNRAINDFFHINAPMADLTHNNHSGGGIFSDSSEIVIVDGAGNGGAYRWGSAAHSYAMRFDPEIVPDLTSSFMADPLDTSGAVFGFQTKTGYRGTGLQYNRWILHKDSISGGPQTVLDDVEPDHELHYASGAPGVDTVPTWHPWHFDYSNGRRWYFTINLRLLDTNSIAGDTILTIRLPYRTNLNYSGNIVFDSVFVAGNPVQYIDSTGNRWDSTLSVHPGSDKTTFAITKQMLPSALSSSPDITLSAFFEFENSDNTNLPIQRTPGKVNYITNLGIQVKYYDNANIGIDWMRFIGAYHNEKGISFHGRCVHDVFVYYIRTERRSGTDQHQFQ